MNATGFDEVLSRAERIHDGPALQAAIARMARDIDAALGGSPAVFLTVMQGALVFAGHLATSITAPLAFDYVHATRYRGTTTGSDLHWIKRPGIDLAGATVLLVDDILDEGHTLAAIRDECLGLGAARVWLVALCEKRHGRGLSDLRPDFCGVEVPDRYVFGYGMDYHEQGRNLPAIYAVDA
jgi:hypoxanthine phosphoribosyltransferase